MPVMRGKDKDGPYFKYGKTGKKYHFKVGDAKSRNAAKKKAGKQGQAIEISKHNK